MRTFNDHDDDEVATLVAEAVAQRHQRRDCPYCQYGKNTLACPDPKQCSYTSVYEENA